jgi:putative glutamine amidotransferase
MVIGVTDTMISEDKFNLYIKWLEGSGILLNWIKLSYRLDNLNALNDCNGLILTGGNDINPALYNGPVNHPHIKDVDRKRDDFERKLIDQALNKKIPTLAICRGMQLVNIHLGGTLIPDIEEAGYKSHRKNNDIENRHPVNIDMDTLIYKMSNIDSGHVNSSHHQAVAKPGDGLIISVRAEDGIIEGMEFGNIEKDHFILLLQWHPERMMDENNPLSNKILENYLATISNQSTT